MNLEQLKYIVEIKRQGSLKEAAFQQNITLPALSQSISNLEKELNILLFHRSRKGTLPTEEGDRLIEKAEIILEKLQDFMDEAENYTNTLKGELKIAAFPGPMEALVQLITNYKKEYPHIRASIEEDNSQNIIEMVTNHEVDIGLLVYTEQDIQENKHLNFYKLIEGHMITAVNKSSPLAQELVITGKMLENQSIILYNDRSILDFINKFNLVRNNTKILFTTNNVETIRYALEKNTAISIGYSYAYETVTGLANNDKYVTIDFADSYYTPYYYGYIYDTHKGLSRISKEFLSRLRKAAPFK